jgi:hypothetical protein
MTDLALERYSSLVKDNVVFPFTAQELGKVLLRLHQGVINKQGAIEVLNELQKQNKVFIQDVNNFVKGLK